MPHLGTSFALVLSAMVLLSAAAPYRCRETHFNVCSEENKRSSVHERLLVRHLITEEIPDTKINITASVPRGALSSVEEDSTADSRQQSLTIEPCSKHFSLPVDRVCQWSYHCDFDALRLPAIIYQAHLTDNKPRKLRKGNTAAGPLMECTCRKVTATVPVLAFQNCTLGEEEWTLKSIPVVAGYSCLPAP